VVPCDGDGAERRLGHSGVKRRQGGGEETSTGACLMGTAQQPHGIKPQRHPAMAAAVFSRRHVVLPPRRVSHARRGASRSAPCTSGHEYATRKNRARRNNRAARISAQSGQGVWTAGGWALSGSKIRKHQAAPRGGDGNCLGRGDHPNEVCIGYASRGALKIEQTARCRLPSQTEFPLFEDYGEDAVSCIMHHAMYRLLR
jgi:hypothetical protein